MTVSEKLILQNWFKILAEVYLKMGCLEKTIIHFCSSGAQSKVNYI